MENVRPHCLFPEGSLVHAGLGPAGTSKDHVCQRTSRPQLECSVLTAQRWEPVGFLLKRLRAEVNGRQSKRLGQGQILTTSFTRSEDLLPPRVRSEGPAPCSGNLDLGPASTSFPSRSSSSWTDGQDLWRSASAAFAALLLRDVSHPLLL